MTMNINDLLARANTNDPASLDALARALLRSGYGGREAGANDLMVTFTFSESSDIPKDWTGTFAEAEALLDRVARVTGGSYDKTFFTLDAPNGDTYCGRIDLNSEWKSIKTHVSTFCRNVLDPDFMPELDFMYTDGDREDCRKWLAILER